MASSSSSRTWSYDVFFSFHGPDARGGFLSHLRRQFTEKGITMFNDEEIERGHTIAPALSQAIRGSRIAILILSKKYASSSWCLDELLEIMECRETIGQIVLTIFYGVEPSDVRKQTGEFGVAFNDSCGKTEEKRTRWRQALNDAANIAGFDFKNCSDEAKKIRKIANEVADKLHAIPSMIVQEKEAQTSEVQERQLPQTIVGQEIMLDKAWKHLKEDGAGLMGLYGMGGVGKTTLLKQLNNRFSEERCGFDFVIWVVVSKELHLEQIQDEIAEKVGLDGKEWNRKQKSQKTDAIYNFLRKKKFMLFLDDIWEKVDLTEIGVPFPTDQNKCKVVFTTRSQAVCTHMGVEDPMEVQCLGENEAFDLFQKKVGPKTLGSDPGIPDLARIVARKCSGLPLALNVIGETMSCKRTIQEWHDTIYELASYAAKFSDMEEKILRILKYSFDNLKEEHYKSCLLYCSLFPEDDRIPKERLIEYWIGEGIIDASGGIERAENKGYEIIGSLVRASLLIKQANIWGKKYEYVSMHDVVREMALWIASDLGKEKEAFIVRAGVGLNEMPKVKNWNVVRRMSLMKNKIRHLFGESECLELTTLILQDNKLANISSEFFMSMPKLAVLDVSKNSELIELPRISELVSLQYLNLSYTGIRRLPMGLQELRELIHLDLSGTFNLKSIAGISSLHSLKVLKLRTFTCDDNTMPELETLQHLQFLTLGINRLFDLEVFLSSRRLMNCTRELSIWKIAMESSGLVLPVTMDKLCHLNIVESSISEIKMVSPLHNLKNLCTVFISGCEGLKELTLLMFAVNLKELHVDRAEQLEDIINKEKASECKESGIVPFPKLQILWLVGLPELKNIYWSPLPLPCLKEIRVRKCPNLKKLPLNSESGTHGENGLITIYGEKEWIEAVEWEDEATETRFLSSCKQVSVSPTPLYQYLHDSIKSLCLQDQIHDSVESLSVSLSSSL